MSRKSWISIISHAPRVVRPDVCWGGGGGLSARQARNSLTTLFAPGVPSDWDFISINRISLTTIGTSPNIQKGGTMLRCISRQGEKKIVQ